MALFFTNSKRLQDMIGNSADVHLRSEVPAELAGARLDKAAAELFADFSRAELTRWINSGELTVDGRTCKPKSKLIGGEVLELQAERQIREAWHQAESLALDLLYEDEHLVVLNKPAGLVVHPGAGNPAGTLVNALLGYRAELRNLPRAGVVHRLDKDTSGVMVVAASDVAQLRLTRMIAARRIDRFYVAVCEGRMVGGRDIDKPIGRDPHVRTRQAVREDGKPALTEVRVRERYRSHTLVDAKLHTGRTHQIRVHMSSMGYPLVGDRRYGARGKVPQGAAPQLIELIHSFPRQALHAWRLCFEHPVTCEDIDIEAPWPEDFAKLAEGLQNDV